MSCKICKRNTKDKLCKKHAKIYLWDSALQGFRLKKRNTGSRYTQSKYHQTETILVKLLERMYSRPEIITSFHPIWAESPKEVLYEYDIHIKGTNILIEYNGRQHYEFVKFFHKKLGNFKKQIQRDKYKQQLAISNGYKLIVFKHDEPITYNHVYNKLKSINL